MAQIDKNTVSSQNQLGSNNIIKFEHEDGKGKRVLFVGNSITRHSPKPEIGWVNDWGMAASSIEKDYVHIVERKVLEKCPDATFCICQGSLWERNYFEGEAHLSRLQEARDFDADIIVMRLIENCRPIDTFDIDAFKNEYPKLVNYLNKNNAKVIITSSFWKHPGDVALKEYAEKEGMDFIYLGELGEDPAMRADGLFKSSGVSAHPGDRGMEEIAKLIFEKMDKYI